MSAAPGPVTAPASRAQLSQERARRYPISFALEFFLVMLGAQALLDYGLALAAAATAEPVSARHLFVAACTAAVFTVAWRRAPLTERSGHSQS